MKRRVRSYEDISPIEFLLLRDSLGLKKYRKTVKRDPEKREILVNIGLKKIKVKEKDDFLPVGYRRRRLKI
jgi:hypothetical protein